MDDFSSRECGELKSRKFVSETWSEATPWQNPPAQVLLRDCLFVARFGGNRAVHQP
jgi:hypothetical protein